MDEAGIDLIVLLVGIVGQMARQMPPGARISVGGESLTGNAIADLLTRMTAEMVREFSEPQRG